MTDCIGYYLVEYIGTLNCCEGSKREVLCEKLGLNLQCFTLKAPITTAADNIHKIFSLYFRENKACHWM